MNFRELIQNRRDGKRHTLEEFQFLARAVTEGNIPDYQISAWLMAAYLRPLDSEETAWMTLALAQSGETLDLSSLRKPHIDKHSTGGVGDKTSIALLPVLASCGATLVKISGRGLGITGGTVDKLASIPGFSTDLSPSQLIETASKVGIGLSGQTPKLAPADKVLYSLRDATETVGSIPLMVSSILSKKVAVGAETIVIDAKCGSGAFMKDPVRARELAVALRDTATRLGLRIKIALTDMNCPLGFMVGNALEVKEAILTLRGEARGRFPWLVRELGAIALEASGIASSPEAGRSMVAEAIASGRAKEKAREWFEAQGGDGRVVGDLALLPQAVCQVPITSRRAGYVRRIDAEVVGQTAVDLGAGRKKKEDSVDLAVGIELRVEEGNWVNEGDILAVVHTNHDQSKNAYKPLYSAFELYDGPVEPKSLILEVI